MKKVQPIPGKDLYIFYDFLDQEDIDIMKRYSFATYFYEGSVSHEERLALDFLPNYEDRHLGDKMVEITHKVLKKMRSTMQETFPDVKIEHFRTYDGISIRTPEGGYRDGKMKEHVDGPAEIDSPDNGIKSLGALLYINDNYDGGELYYPRLNWEYKPVANSFVIHRGEPDYLHGVKEIFNGWRLNIGAFAFEYYPEYIEDFKYGDQVEDKVSQRMSKP